MRVQYRGIEFQQVRLINYAAYTELDPTGYDGILTRIEMEISFVWHPFATASNPANAAAPPFDSIGLSLRRLRNLLNRPRGVLRVAIAADQTWEVPAIDPATGTAFPSDPNYGPFPEVVGLGEIEGERLAMGRWKVKFWIQGASNILLSNRWAVSVKTNDCGMSTRTIDGWAQCRADAVLKGDVNGIDDLRRWLLVPCPSGFIRLGADVEVNEINTVGHYVVTDQEDPNPLGADGATAKAVKFTGEASSGTISNFKSWKALLKGAMEIDLMSLLPENIASGVVQITGGKTVNKNDLLKVAISILQDRFPQGTVVSLICTQGIGQAEKDGRWIKLTMLFRPTLAVELGKVVDFRKIQAQMVLDQSIAPGFGAGFDPNDIVLAGNTAKGPQTGAVIKRNGVLVVLNGDMPPNEADTDYQNWNLPSSVRPGDNSGSRGSWLGALLTQTIQAQGTTPDIPPANKPGVNANLV